MAVPSEKVSSRIRKICGFTSSCACARSHPGLYSPLIHSIVSSDSESDSEGSDQTAHSRSLIWAFAVRACPKGILLLGAAQLWNWYSKCLNSTVYIDVPRRASSPLPHHTTRDRPTEPVISNTPLGDMKIPEPKQ